MFEVERIFPYLGHRTIGAYKLGIAIICGVCICALGCGKSIKASGDDAASSTGDVALVPQVDVSDTSEVAPIEPECSEVKACDAGLICDCDSRCVEDPGTLECTEDKNCGSGAYCDICTGKCRDLKMICTGSFTYSDV